MRILPFGRLTCSMMLLVSTLGVQGQPMAMAVTGAGTPANVRPAPVRPLPSSPTSTPPSSASAHNRPGLLALLEHQQGRPLSREERQVVHDVLRDTVVSWRKTQAEFNEDAAQALHTTPEVIDGTLPRKGLRRIGATRDEGWLPRVEHTLGRRLTPPERERLEQLASSKHARIEAARAQAIARLAHALGMTSTAVDNAWPWPKEPASARPTSVPSSPPSPTVHPSTPGTPTLPLPPAPEMIQP